MPDDLDELTFEPVKTADMLAVERAHGGRDIRLLILDGVRECPRNRDVAHRLGLLPTTISKWIAQLGIKTRVREIRAEQRRSAA